MVRKSFVCCFGVQFHYIIKEIHQSESVVKSKSKGLLRLQKGLLIWWKVLMLFIVPAYSNTNMKMLVLSVELSSHLNNKFYQRQNNWTGFDSLRSSDGVVLSLVVLREFCSSFTFYVFVMAWNIRIILLLDPASQIEAKFLIFGE